MDNFDLKKFLIENKITTNSQMLDEAANLKDIMSKLQAGDFASLAKIPGDQKLAQTILKTLKQSQPELLKKLTAYAKKNEKMLAEGAIKNTLIGLLIAGVLGLGFSAATDSSTRSQAADKGVATTQQSQATDYQNGYKMLDFYKNNKEKIQKLAQDDFDVKAFAGEMETLSKAPNQNDLMQSMGGDSSTQSAFQHTQSQIKSISTAQYK
jgi:hypothetical protein